MNKFIQAHKDEMIKFCEDNGISYEKVWHSPKSFNHDIMFIQYVDFSKPLSKVGIDDSKPAKILLTITKTEDGSGLVIKPEADFKEYLT